MILYALDSNLQMAFPAMAPGFAAVGGVPDGRGLTMPPNVK